MTVRERLIEFLKSKNILTLATVAKDGSPRATPLFYLFHDDLCLYWVSSSSSGHSRNISSEKEASVAVYATTDRWREIRGAQMRGTVHVVVGEDERKEVFRSYVQRFHLGRLLSVAMHQNTLYRFNSTWACLLDNSKRFGYKRELKLQSH